MPDGVKVAVKVMRLVLWVDSQASRLPFVAASKTLAADMVLDTLFGPAEDIDYVSKTAPASPPPTP